MASVDVTFTEQSLHVQLTLHKAGTVWLDCVEPQSAAHRRVNVGTSLVAVNGARMGKLFGRQAWVTFCERIRNMQRPMTLTFSYYPISDVSSGPILIRFLVNVTYFLFF